MLTLMHRASVHPWLVLVLLAALGCSRGDSTTPADEKAADGKAAAAGAACDAAHTKALEQELGGLCDLGELVSPIDVPPAPWKPAPAAAAPDALRIDVTAAGVVLGWGEPVPIAELRSRLTEGFEKNQMLAEAQGTTYTGMWLLSMAKQTPRAEVAAVLQALVDAERYVGFVQFGIAAAEPLPQPRDPKQLADLDARMSAVTPGDEAVFLAKEIERAASSCPAFEQAFSNVSTVDADDRCKSLARSLADGIQRCGCDEETVMMTLFYALTVGRTPPSQRTAALRVTLDAAAPTPRPGATWGEVVARLDEDALAGLWVAPG